MESLEPSPDERPTEERRKDGEGVRATQTGGREPVQRGGPLAKQSPPSLAGKSGGAGWSVFRQQEGLDIWKVIS